MENWDRRPADLYLLCILDIGKMLFFHAYRLSDRSAALQGSSGAFGVDLGRIWEAFANFGCHFGDFSRIRFIFENVCFIIVKAYFLRSGRVLDHDSFVLCF